MSTPGTDLPFHIDDSSVLDGPCPRTHLTLANDNTDLAALLAEIGGHAKAVDTGERDVREAVLGLARLGFAALGAPRNTEDQLVDMASLISDVAAECMSTAFSLWAHRMTIEYLTAAGSTWATRTAADLAAGNRLGVTGMASAFKEAAGCGSLDLTATPVAGGYLINGALRWASNLHPDSMMVSAARSDDERRLIFAIPLDADGVTIGAPFELLAMDGTASSFLTIKDAFVPEEQVLSDDFLTFLGAARPTFLVLQSAMCLGLASRCLVETRGQLEGVNAVYTKTVKGIEARLETTCEQVTEIARATGTDHSADKVQLLTMRLAAAEIATAAAGAEVRTAGGKGYARRTPTSRRFREATFIPVQSPSETQLRWELSQLL